MNAFRDSLEIRPRPSRLVWLFVVLTHGVGLILTTVLAARWPWAWLVFGVVLVSFGRQLRRSRLAHPGAVRWLRWRQDGAWVVETVAAGNFEASLLPSSLCLPGLIALHLRSGKRRFDVLLAPDSLDQDCARRLRARLRLAPQGVAKRAPKSGRRAG